jgi:hypothetical protein
MAESTTVAMPGLLDKLDFDTKLSLAHSFELAQVPIRLWKTFLDSLLEARRKLAAVRREERKAQRLIQDEDRRKRSAEPKSARAHEIWDTLVGDAGGIEFITAKESDDLWQQAKIMAEGEQANTHKRQRRQRNFFLPGYT